MPTLHANAANQAKRCQECWGTHPNHKAYCSWSVGSKEAKANIINPDYKNAKDRKVEINGGYTGISRHIADIWGTTNDKSKADAPKEANPRDAPKDEQLNDWEKVEGDWVEI